MKLKIFFLIIGSFFLLKNNYAQGNKDSIIRIPVIFHVLYADHNADNGISSISIDKGNSTGNIPTEKLIAELKDLHDDFLAINADTANVINEFKKSIGRPNVEFYLADTILQLNGERGIIRIYTTHNQKKLYRISPVVNSRKYLNVYIGNIRFQGHYPDGVTPVPENASYHEDDVVHLSYKWVGLHYRLLTHETGHWLGLFHVFEGGCDDDDGISDTPPQKSATDGLCVSCPPTIIDQSCTNNPSNFNNFMDYSGCRKMFTIEQAKRIRQTIQSFRTEIWRTKPN